MKNCDTIFSTCLELTLSLALSTEQPYPTVSSTHTLSIDTPRVTAEDIVRMFEEDVRARKRLAEILVSDESVRLAMINAVLRDVATKHGIEKLRNEFRDEIKELRDRVENIEQRLAKLFGCGSLGEALRFALSVAKKEFDKVEEDLSVVLGSLKYAKGVGETRAEDVDGYLHATDSYVWCA